MSFFHFFRVIFRDVHFFDAAVPTEVFFFLKNWPERVQWPRALFPFYPATVPGPAGPLPNVAEYRGMFLHDASIPP